MTFLSLLRVILICIVFIRLTTSQDCKNGVKNEPFTLPPYFPQYGFCHNETLIKQMVPKTCCVGYYEDDGNCLPVCKNGCQNGQCRSPDNCKCNDGYDMANGRCVPHCKNCANGYCLAPNECVCAAGFRKSDAGLCVPQCKDGCVNGICNEQDQCICRNGYYFNEKLLNFGIRNNTVCTPNCDRPCLNGTCTGRNSCECFPGYGLSKNDRFTCTPVCDYSWMNCTHGQCTDHNRCVCNPGYMLTIYHESKLICAYGSQIHKSSFDFNSALRTFCIIASIITGVVVIVVVAVKVFKCVFRNKCQINIYGHGAPEVHNDAEYGGPSNSPMTTTVMSSSPLPQTHKKPNSKDTKM